MKLTDKQEAFCREYLLDCNATQAAIRAGYSKDTARQMGSELLGKATVSDEIARLKAERSDLTKVDAAYVLMRLHEENEADLADLFADTGALLDAADMPLIWRKGLIVGFEVEEIYEKVDEPDTMEPQAHGGSLRRPGAKRVAAGRIVKVKLSERIKRTELIGKHVTVKAFEDRVHLSGMDGIAERLEAAAKAVEQERKREIADAIRRDREEREA